LTFARSESPAKDQSWRPSRPSVHGLGWIRTTAVGPALHFPEPNWSSVAVSIISEGPIPQMISGLGRRKEYGIIDVTQPGGTIALNRVRNLGRPRDKTGRVNKWHNHTIDQVPVANSYRNHRLDVQESGFAVVRAIIEGKLEWQAVHGPHRVLSLCGQISATTLLGFFFLLCQYLTRA